MNRRMRTIKKIYQAPNIESVKLDNEISLVLNSFPPDGPNESFTQNTPVYLNMASQINTTV